MVETDGEEPRAVIGDKRKQQVLSYHLSPITYHLLPITYEKNWIYQSGLSEESGG
jgi:hypothetical protein